MFKKLHGIVIVLLIIAMSFLAACTKDTNEGSASSETKGSKSIEQTTKEQPEGITQDSSSNASSSSKDGESYLLEKDLVIQNSRGEIKLGAWDTELDLQGVLGKPRQEEITQLGEGADTFTGSYIKKQIYNGLELGFMSPKGNGKTFYIDTIIVTGSEFVTARNIKVGDSRQKLMDAYYPAPPIPTSGHEKDILFYRFKDQGNIFIDFKVKGETIQSITLKIEHP